LERRLESRYNSGDRGWLSVACGPQDLLRNLRERDDALQDSHLSASARHAVHDAASLILSESDTAATVNGFDSQGSIRAHPGHDNTHGETAVNGSYGLHHDIDGRHVHLIRGLPSKGDHGPRIGRPFHNHMNARRGNVDDAGADRFAVGGFVNFDQAQFVQSLGKGSGEAGRHVLHDQNGHREIAREKGEHVLKSFWATSGYPNGDNCRHDGEYFGFGFA